MSFSEGSPAPYTPTVAWGAFSTWAACHEAWRNQDGNIVTYYDLGFELRSRDDVFQINIKNSTLLLSWAVFIRERFLADTVVLEVPSTHRGILEFGLEKSFYDRRGPVVMVLRKRRA